ncbi:MAG TPA: hypothetical protein VG097_15440 [Gemmata sp.]|nr:hypothetical protein [Gemmata sp.]
MGRDSLTTGGIAPMSKERKKLTDCIGPDEAAPDVLAATGAGLFGTKAGLFGTEADLCGTEAGVCGTEAGLRGTAASAVTAE